VSVLDSAAAVLRARAAIGRPDGAGMCLANNYAWWGSVQSIGPGAGHFARAIDGWNYATERHADMLTAPAGVPVYFGVSPTRHDKNAAAGDIGLSLGNGYGIFTDSPNGTPGVMSFRARAAQIARPMLGWTEDFLGHDTTAGVQYANSGVKNPPVTITLDRKPIIPVMDWIDMNLRLIPHPADEKGVQPGVNGGWYIHNLDTGKKKAVEGLDDLNKLRAIIYGNGEDGARQLYQQELDVMLAKYAAAVK
jgi:hypothetical protein